MNDRPPVSLSELDARLSAYRKQQAEEEARRVHHRFLVPRSTLDLASRVLNDLIAAVLIAIAFGVTIDSVFDSWPWGIVSMFVLGGAAAIRNVYQTASRMANDDSERPPQSEAPPNQETVTPSAPTTKKRG
jgi:F0F1-type ATP synthase assembly protein I